MALEDAINRLADLTEAHTKVMLDLMKGAKGTAAAGDAESAPAKPGRKKKEEGKTEDDGASGEAADADAVKELVGKVKGWLKEFAGNESDPENEARGEKLTKALKTLGIEAVSKIKTEDHRSRVENWVEKQIAAGRITPDPKADEGGEGEDEI